MTPENKKKRSEFSCIFSDNGRLWRQGHGRGSVSGGDTRVGDSERLGSRPSEQTPCSPVTRFHISASRRENGRPSPDVFRSSDFTVAGARRDDYAPCVCTC